MTTRHTPPQSSLRIGRGAFLLAFGILLGLMLLSGVLTRVVPAGSFERELVNGREMVIPGSYQLAPEHQAPPVWRWFTAPVEVLFAPGAVVAITIIVFLIFVGGSFAVLERSGVLQAVLNRLVGRFYQRRYLLMAIIIFFFMAVASVLGIYEAMVPLIVFIVPLALKLGWDSLTGLGMSLLPLAFGFAAAVSNPFTIGVAQRIAELPLFSGAWLRIPFFLLTYGAVLLFVRRHARRVEANPERSPVYRQDTRRRELLEREAAAVPHGSQELPAPMYRAARWFGGCIALAFVFIFITARNPVLSDLAFPLMALLFLVGGIGAGILSGMPHRRVAAGFLGGAASMLPAVLLILMSLSVRHIVDAGGITDTILETAAGLIAGSTTFGAAFFVYLVTLGMNFFIGSASAKAFLMMPILAPLADLVGITRQTAVLAFGFGDGFSNMLYPSNALLLIGLGFTVVSYPRWVRWTILLQGSMFAISMLFLWIAVQTGYGPF
ncbi:YfcC family protein [Spirochaeta africana]|uniref:Putative membrane protein n=1 Tax=Spirochaeta africana (strain ATCC 700263 / DSM 8902 / Z-7692) TaxID=889378 RepID=H9UGH3_SPIAZ|nr:Na+/H+ antiporter NhaC family protein [Spirochaeta africana]AFG36616.1 putative membrane protein [Spirochaeta africana DSM 8902]